MRRILTALAGVARDAHIDSDLRTLFVEGQRTNLIVKSRQVDVAPWAIEAGVTVTPNAAVGMDGQRSAARIISTIGGNGIYQASATPAANGTKYTASVWLKAPVPTTCLVGVNRAGGLDGASQIVNLTPDWQRFPVTSPSVWTGATNVTIVVRPQGLLAVDVDFAQLEVGAFASSEIVTDAATVTRVTDSIYAPWPTAPAALSLYLKFVERGTALGAGSIGVFQIADAFSAAPYFAVWADGAGNYAAAHDNGGGVVISSPIAAPALGDVVELLATLAANGSVQLTIVINGGAPVVGAASAPNALAGGWSDTKLWIGRTPGAGTGYAAFNRIVALAGIQTLAAMRALAAGT